MTSGIKAYRITIEGFITTADFSENSIEPDGWPLEELMKALGQTPDIKVTATLVDTIPWESEQEGE